MATKININMRSGQSEENRNLKQNKYNKIKDTGWYADKVKSNLFYLVFEGVRRIQEGP